jgi:hypothetical protein
LSPLSDLDSDKSDDENCDTPNRIPKPKGEAGRSNSGGYNLMDALGWEEKRYHEFTVSYKCQISKTFLTFTNRPLSMMQLQKNWIQSGATVNRSRLRLRG